MSEEQWEDGQPPPDDPDEYPEGCCPNYSWMGTCKLDGDLCDDCEDIGRPGGSGID
ncbi:hypothetical protein FACS1894137_14090 [Spirochaetia bacterium]|nr:hypothetical protein FACS1894137_14090 [Spirochaetia bacterium]